MLSKFSNELQLWGKKIVMGDAELLGWEKAAIVGSTQADFDHIAKHGREKGINSAHFNRFYGAWKSNKQWLLIFQFQHVSWDQLNWGTLQSFEVTHVFLEVDMENMRVSKPNRIISNFLNLQFNWGVVHSFEVGCSERQNRTKHYLNLQF